MFENRLRRYTGLIGLITALIVFVIFAVVTNSILNTQIFQRDYLSATRTANYAQVLSRVGPEDEQLRDDIVNHITMIRDGGALISQYGPSWEKPAATNSDIIAAIKGITDALAANDLAAFDRAYVTFSEVSAQTGFDALERMQVAQLIVAAIIFAGFLSILGILFIRLGRADDLAEQAAAETTHILDAVDDGLFLIDQELQIGKQKSRAMAEIFGRKAKIQGDFTSFLKAYISDEDMHLTQEYVQLLLDGRVKEKLMVDLNPLQRMPIAIKHLSGAVEQKYLNFQFSKRATDIADSDTSKKVILVTIADVTKEVLLQQQLEETKEQQKERMSLLMSVLQVKSEELIDFLDKSDTTWVEINEILSGENADHAGNLEKLNDIFSRAHKLKGHAGALQLDFFETSIHRFADAINAVKDQTYIDWRMMLDLTIQLNDLVAESELVRGLAPKIKELTSLDDSPSADGEIKPSETMQSGESLFADRLITLVNSTAKREGKKVDLDCKGFDLLEFDPERQQVVYEIAVQLVRNCIVHGIESPAQRLQMGKKPIGLVSVAIATEEGERFSLSVRDDGRGIQFDDIRDKAVSKKLIDARGASGLKPNQLLKYLFKPGFSLAHKPGADAGRGVGLVVVKKQIRKLSGRISIRTTNNKFSQFVVFLPKVAA